MDRLPGAGHEATIIGGRPARRASKEVPLDSPSRRPGRVAAARALPWAGGLGLAALILGPALAPGYVLRYDMVFVPRPPATPDLVGLGERVARAVPSDAVVAGLSHLLPGDVVEKLVLLAILTVAAVGAGRLTSRLLRGADLPVGVAAATAGCWYAWNRWVGERLLIGHWALLAGYAALPWIAAAALGVRRGEAGARRRLLGSLLGPAVGGIAATAIALPVLAACLLPRPRIGRPGGGWGVRQEGRTGGRRRDLLLVAGFLVVVAAPWWVPSALRPGGVPAARAGVAAFAARAEPHLSVPGSLLALGGIWNREVAPASGGVVPTAALLAALAVAAGGVVLLVRGVAGPGARGPATRLLVAAAAGYLLAVSTAVPGLRDGVATLVAHLPGAGELRDAQKWVAPLALLEAVGIGTGAAALVRLVAAARVRRAAAVLAVAAPLAVLPSLGWGAGGRLAAVGYPADWYAARRAIAAAGAPGALAVLPWSAYHRYGWNGDRTVLDPAWRFFDRPVVGSDALLVGGLRVPGEAPTARRLDPVVAGTGPLTGALRRAGVALVLVEGDRAGPAGPAGPAALLHRLPGGRRLLTTPILAVVALPGPAPYRPARPPVAAVLAADAAALAAAAGALAALLAGPLLATRKLGGQPADT
ncbi:MAG: hypothetical protein ACJ74O_00010 [Frankiaceae bacterium]